MNKINFDKLVEWQENPRNISPDAFLRLKKQLILKGFSEVKPFLVTRIDTNDDSEKYLTLGGNQRYKALKELLATTPEYMQIFIKDHFGYDVQDNMVPLIIDRLREVPVTIIEFIQKPEGYWVAKENGVEQLQRFNDRDSAMVEWAMFDNDSFGYTDKDRMGNLEGSVDIDWTLHAQSFMETPTIDELLKGTTEGEVSEEDSEASGGKGEEIVECPNCHTRFSAKENIAKLEVGENPTDSQEMPIDSVLS